ncbi:CGNR zinc finger domain-containing protein [Oxalobacteraceae sp. CFBP 13730]|nr:CGNR zinc finger domain-containing protein [Oxalobacteraceae sp. CFBP 13730]
MGHVSQPGLDAAPLIADHLALDMLNTEAGTGDAQQDFWRSGNAVLAWLERSGIDPGEHPETVMDDFLRDARALRAAARDLISRRMQGERGDPALLNRYLAAMVSTPALVWDAAQPQLVRQGREPSPARALGTLAEAVAALLADGDFALVRQCEHPECVLWFYDRTKSHRRRWCSMALCGNRHKAAQFRARNRPAA